MRLQLFTVLSLAIGLHSAVLAQQAPQPPLRADRVAYLALYKELVETNTTLSAGSCTLAAERVAAHLKAAGFADSDITPFSVPEHPREGGVVADPKVIGPAEKLAAKYFPGVPLIPAMSTGATDGIFLEAIGIPVYGVPGI